MLLTWSCGRGGREDCVGVSRAASHRQIEVRSGATATPAKASGYASRRRKAERSSEMVPGRLPRWKWWKEAASWINPCRKVFSGSCAASQTDSQCSCASKNVPERKQRRPSRNSPWVQSSDMPFRPAFIVRRKSSGFRQSASGGIDRECVYQSKIFPVAHDRITRYSYE